MDGHRLVHKRELYRTAVESALDEGEISPKERGVLAMLQSSSREGGQRD